MIARATTCVGLSLGIAWGAAVALHRPDSLLRAKITTSNQRAPKVLDEGQSTVVPSPTPVVAWEEPVSSPLSSTRDQDLVRPSPRSERGEVVKVLEGETLESLTTRVYGQTIDLDAFWKLNRDQLQTRETPLKPGMLLRTPDLSRHAR